MTVNACVFLLVVSRKKGEICLEGPGEVRGF